jgi:uncharacterized membrane protein
MTNPSDAERKDAHASATRAEEKVPCALCGEPHSKRRLTRLGALRRPFFEHAAKSNPEKWQPDSRVCKKCLDKERVSFVLERLQAERGELSEVEADIAQKAAQHAFVAESIEEDFARRATTGQRLADRVARIGGSWPFVGGFFLFLAGWMVWNTWILRAGAFDPYPYILLNLLLSCVAAVQAPIIMMSQNRLAARDRAQADQDFRTNLKAEIEIVGLHEKVDHLLHAQYERLVELQEVQLDLLQEIARKGKG